jgi:hypothetical protein
MFWGVWALLMIDDKDICNENIFNYEFVKERARLNKYLKKQFGIQ